MSNTVRPNIIAWPSWIIENKITRQLLRSRFYRRLFGTLGPEYIVYPINGCRYFCNLLDYTGVGHYFLKNNHYEPYITQLILKYISPTADVLDIGANIGYFSILCAKHTQGKVYAFEPEPTNFHHLSENIRLNELSNIQSFNFALGPTNEEINFYVNSKNKGDHRCSKFEDNLSKVIKVPIKRLDETLSKEEFDRIRLIKIDVQGFELKVCQGMEAYLKSAHDLTIISEFEFSSLKQAGDEPMEYLTFMQACGFEVSIIDEGQHHLRPAMLDEILVWAETTPVVSLLFVK